MRLLGEAKRLAKQYYQLTRRPLGVTGEVAEYEAIRLLHLQHAPVRQPGYDAEGQVRNGRRERLQIKGRCLSGKTKPGARIGPIDLSKPWDAVLLVLLDADFNATAIYRAERPVVRAALLAPGKESGADDGPLGAIDGSCVEVGVEEDKQHRVPRLRQVDRSDSCARLGLPRKAPALDLKPFSPAVPDLPFGIVPGLAHRGGLQVQEPDGFILGHFTRYAQWSPSEL